MYRRCLLLLCPVGAFSVWAQQAPVGPQDEMRRTVERYMDAVRRGDSAVARAISTSNGRRVSAGGTTEFGLGERLPSWKHRSNMIRRSEMLSPSTGIVIGVWKDFDAKPPFDTGTFHYTLTREGASWTVSYVHEAFLPAAQTVSSLSDGAIERNPTQEGWEQLFDGQTLAGWSGSDPAEELGRSWRVEDGCIVAIPGGPRSSLLTRRRYLFFDLRFQWKAERNTNSGVKYRVFGFDRILDGSREALGFEYQVADDDGDPGARIDPKQRSGALYSVTPVEHSVSKPLGQWNNSRIVVTASQIEHWLNGTATARYATDIPFASAIVLQHHTTEVRFRDVRIRSLSSGVQ